jgi:uncharacterized protein YndB with AHSA1/START domain
MVWIEHGARTADPEQVVLRSQPYERLSYTWHTFTPQWAAALGVDESVRTVIAGERRTTVTFQLEPHKDGVQLTVVHENFEPGGALRGMCSQAWPAILAQLQSLLEDEELGAQSVRRQQDS